MLWIAVGPLRDLTSGQEEIVGTGFAEPLRLGIVGGDAGVGAAALKQQGQTDSAGEHEKYAEFEFHELGTPRRDSQGGLPTPFYPIGGSLVQIDLRRL